MSEPRWGRALAVRLSLAGLAAIGLAAVGVDATSGVRRPLVVVVGYVAVIGMVELGRRAYGRRRDGCRGRGLRTPLVLLDGLMVTIVVTATGGPASPLEFLVLLHVAAMGLIVSGRSAVEASVWYAALLLVVAAAAPTTTTFVHVGAYLGAGAAIAGSAVFEARSERQRQNALADQVRLLARLEHVVSVEEACVTLAEHVVNAGYQRAAVLVMSGQGVVGATVVTGQAAAVVAAPLPRRPGRLLSHGDEQAPVLTRFLDPDADPLLDQLLPGAMNLVGVPVVVDGDTRGVAVAEWEPGIRARIPDEAAETLRQDAAHCGLALRVVLLLEQVEQRSRLDLLTGCTNRRGFDEALDRELARTDRSGRPMSLALIDLDHFKAVNDTKGHQAGDRVLALVGSALRRVARAEDTAARIGGDEFALILPDCESMTAAQATDRVLAAVATAVGHEGVTASAGVATAPPNGRTRGALVHAADEALYAAKAAGRNRCVRAADGRTRTEPLIVLDGSDGQMPPHWTAGRDEPRRDQRGAPVG